MHLGTVSRPGRCACSLTCVDEDVEALRATYSSELPVSFLEMDVTEGGDLPEAHLVFSQDVLQVSREEHARVSGLVEWPQVRARGLG